MDDTLRTEIKHNIESEIFHILTFKLEEANDPYTLAGLMNMIKIYIDILKSNGINKLEFSFQ